MLFQTLTHLSRRQPNAAFLLAQAALNRGTLNVFSELLSYEYGHKFCRIDVPAAFVGGLASMAAGAPAHLP